MKITLHIFPDHGMQEEYEFDSYASLVAHCTTKAGVEYKEAVTPLQDVPVQDEPVVEELPEIPTAEEHAQNIME